MRLHVLGMAFSETTHEWEHCAFTARTRDFCTMMTRAGAEVILYAGEHNEAEVTEHVPVVIRSEQRQWWPDYEPKRDVFNDFDPAGQGWSEWNRRAVDAISQRSEPGDVLCITMGTTHQPVADALPGLYHVETGIGYSGVWAPFRIYESWAWRNYITGHYGPDDTHKCYDTVLPRAYPAEDFPLGAGDGGYYLFLGRLTERKGPHIAAMACERIGAKLVVAGQGDYPLSGDVEYVGTVDAAERARLMGGAIATFCPSMYLEPLCGVSIEAQLTGCPVIASNWGALVENVTHNETGFLCDTLADYAEGALMAPALDRLAIQKRAQRWTTDALGPRYAAHFRRIQGLAGDGWYT